VAERVAAAGAAAGVSQDVPQDVPRGVWLWHLPGRAAQAGAAVGGE
jgi:hypothetical protein